MTPIHYTAKIDFYDSIRKRLGLDQLDDTTKKCLRVVIHDQLCILRKFALAYLHMRQVQEGVKCGQGQPEEIEAIQAQIDFEDIIATIMEETDGMEG